MKTSELDGLPGGELVAAGIEDCRAGRRSIPALLVRLARTRLSDLGLELAPAEGWPADGELALYRALGEDPSVSDVYYRYNSLKRELDSFLATLEARVARSR